MGCFAVFFTELANETIEDASSDHDDSKMKHYWGTVMTSLLSLLMALSGGDDWRNFIDVYRGHGSYVPMTLVFSFYILFGTLVMLNLVTGVFVEGAQRLIKEDKQKDSIRMAAQIFIG